MQSAATTKAPAKPPSRGAFRRLIFLSVIATCAGVNAITAIWALWTHPAFNSDFLAFWSFPRFARTQNILSIYNAASLQSFQQHLYPGFHSFYPYLYPPTLLLPTWWLTNLNFATAQTLWTLAGLAAITAATWHFFKPPLRWLAIIAMLASPASLLNGSTGETAYFTSALLLLGFGCLPTRPIIAGIAFGLLTLKPQLGILIPFALLARGEWLAIAAASFTALALVGISCAMFPPNLWLAWMHTLPVYQTQYFAAAKALNLNIIVTIPANLITLGISPAIAWTLQLVASLAAATAVFLLFRRGPYPLAMAALFTGTFLTAPHAYAYDTTILTAAILLLTPTSTAATLICLVIYLGPFLLLSPAHSWFLYAFPEVLLFITVIRLALSTAPGANSPHEPIHQSPVLRPAP